MAKQSIVKQIKAKPNARGKTSHLPMMCQTKDCDKEAVVFHGTFDKRVKVCYDCFASNAEKKPAKSQVADIQATLKALGLIK